MIEKVAIIGAGAWGMALALHLAREKKCAVSLWSVREASRNNLKVARGNDLLLPGIVLPSQIEISDSFTNAISGAGLLVSSVPSAHLLGCHQDIGGHTPYRLWRVADFYGS